MKKIICLSFGILLLNASEIYGAATPYQEYTNQEKLQILEQIQELKLFSPGSPKDNMIETLKSKLRQKFSWNSENETRFRELLDTMGVQSNWQAIWNAIRQSSVSATEEFDEQRKNLQTIISSKSLPETGYVKNMCRQLVAVPMKHWPEDYKETYRTIIERPDVQEVLQEKRMAKNTDWISPEEAERRTMELLERERQEEELNQAAIRRALAENRREEGTSSTQGLDIARRNLQDVISAGVYPEESNLVQDCHLLITAPAWSREYYQRYHEIMRTIQLKIEEEQLSDATVAANWAWMTASVEQHFGGNLPAPTTSESEQSLKRISEQFFGVIERNGQDFDVHQFDPVFGVEGFFNNISSPNCQAIVGYLNTFVPRESAMTLEQIRECMERDLRECNAAFRAENDLNDAHLSRAFLVLTTTHTNLIDAFRQIYTMIYRYTPDWRQDMLVSFLSNVNKFKGGECYQGFRNRLFAMFCLIFGHLRLNRR